MPNISEKKMKLLHIGRFLLEKTDEAHTVTLPQILEELKNCGITAERKSIYDDIETLRGFGIPIEKRKTRTFEYFMKDRRFSLEEIKFLVDAVNRSSALSRKRREALVNKLKTLCSVYQAQELEAAVSSGATNSASAAVKEHGGNGEKVTLEFTRPLLEQVTERFGSEITVEASGKNKLRTTVRTTLEQDFFSWLFSLGTDAKLLSPKKAAEQFREKAKAMAKLYKS